MSIVHVPKNSNNPFFMCDHNVFGNIKLSLQASAILTYLISKPANWVVRIQDIVSHFTNGAFSVRSAMTELISAGYIVRNPIRSNNGKFIRHDYIVYENPLISNPNINKLHKRNPKPLHQKQQVANPQLNNIKKERNNDSCTTKYYNKFNPLSVAQENLLNEESKHHTKLLLYEFGINNFKKLFDMFPDFDIFCYVDWMMPFKHKIRNKMGYLITALRDRWHEPELFMKSRQPSG